MPNKQDRERIAIELKENNGKYKRGKRCQKQIAVLVIAKSKTVELLEKYKHKLNKKGGVYKSAIIGESF